MAHFYCKLERLTHCSDSVTLTRSSYLKWQRHVTECWWQYGRDVIEWHADACLQAKEAPRTTGVEAETEMVVQSLLRYLRVAVASVPHLQCVAYIKIGGFEINIHGTRFLWLGKMTFLRWCGL